MLTLCCTSAAIPEFWLITSTPAADCAVPVMVLDMLNAPASTTLLPPAPPAPPVAPVPVPPVPAAPVPPVPSPPAPPVAPVAPVAPLPAVAPPLVAEVEELPLVA